MAPRGGAQGQETEQPRQEASRAISASGRGRASTIARHVFTALRRATFTKAESAARTLYVDNGVGVCVGFAVGAGQMVYASYPENYGSTVTFDFFTCYACRDEEERDAMGDTQVSLLEEAA